MISKKVNSYSIKKILEWCRLDYRSIESWANSYYDLRSYVQSSEGNTNDTFTLYFHTT